VIRRELKHITRMLKIGLKSVRHNQTYFKTGLKTPLLVAKNSLENYTSDFGRRNRVDNVPSDIDVVT
jgi:hypothetical protein